MSSVGAPRVDWKAAGTDSDLCQLQGHTICGFYIPAGFLGTTLSIKTTYNPNAPGGFPVIDSTGATLTYTVSASKYLKVDPADFAGISAFQLVSGASEVAGTSIRVALREIA